MRRAAFIVVSIVVLGFAAVGAASAQTVPPLPGGGFRATTISTTFDSGNYQASQSQPLSSLSSFRVLMLSRWTSWGTDVLAQRLLRTSTFALRERTGWIR
jgi:hypothetical protein